MRAVIGNAFSRGAGGRRARFGTAAIVIEAVLAVTCLALVVAKQGLPLPFLSNPDTVEVAVSDAGGLKEENRPPVTVAGVQAGRVTRVRYDDGQAVVRIELDDGMRGRLHADASALIVPRSALNDMTVDIDPGTERAGPLADEARLAQSPEGNPVGLDRLVGVLDDDTRADLQVLLGELRVGLKGRSGELRAAVRELGSVVDSTGQLADALADRRRLLTRLVDDSNVTFRTLGNRGDQLRQAISAGRTTFATVGGRQRQLAAAMRRFPGTLAEVNRALSETTRLAQPLDPALERLRPVASELPAALRQLRSFVPPGRRLVRDLDFLARRGRRPARDLRRLLRELGPASTALRPPVAKLFPIVKALDRHKPGIGEIGANFSGIFSTNDANGPVLRGLGFFEDIDPENFGAPGASGRRLASLQTDVARALTRVCLTENDLACLVRYLVPGLPGSVRSAARPIGDPKLARRWAARHGGKP